MITTPQYVTHDDVHNLDEALGQWLLPRIQKYRKETCYCPPDLTNDEWDEVLWSIENAALALYNPRGVPLELRESEIYIGLISLAHYATHLWY